LLHDLPSVQVNGVLAHEFAHIKNRDILVSSIAATAAGAIAAIAEVFQWSLFFGGSEDEDAGPLGWIGLLATIIIAPIAASLLQLAVSRQREYLADATGAQLLGHPAPLAAALETLEHAAKARPMTVNPATASLYIVNPLTRQGLATLFVTHPPLGERVRRLRALDHDQAPDKDRAFPPRRIGIEGVVPGHAVNGGERRGDSVALAAHDAGVARRPDSSAATDSHDSRLRFPRS
jgi:heat shock protein HtpX